jgi:hypothetical protein
MRHVEVLEPQEVTARLRRAIEVAGGIKAFAAKHRITRGIVSNTLHGQRLAPVVLNAIGLKKIPHVIAW